MSLLWLSMFTLAGKSFTDYSDVQHVLAFMNDSRLARPKAWREWVTAHDRDIRKRLLRGDEDTVVNWLLFGTSFTGQPKVFLEVSATSDNLRRLISSRTKDFISALASPDTNERIAFARQLLAGQGYRFETSDEQARLEQHLYAEVDRVVAERQQYQLREEAFPHGDVVAQIMVESSLFRGRGLSLDTSILPSFAIEQALKTMRDKGLLRPNGIRRVAIVGPGLDFADKNSGFDFYPVQTLQPFTSIDSLTRLGLAAPSEIDLTTLDISKRVNDHILAIQRRAKAGSPNLLRLPLDPGAQWTPGLISYWKSVGDQIGTEPRLPRSADVGKGIELRGIDVRPQVVGRITPIDFNVVTEKWTGPPFDLVIATNVLVYYDKLDQLLAFSSIEGMLRPGGFFLTNNAIVELPASRLRSAGVMTVQYSPQQNDHVFWYRRIEP